VSLFRYVKKIGYGTAESLWFSAANFIVIVVFSRYLEKELLADYFVLLSGALAAIGLVKTLIIVPGILCSVKRDSLRKISLLAIIIFTLLFSIFFQALGLIDNLSFVFVFVFIFCFIVRDVKRLEMVNEKAEKTLFFITSFSSIIIVVAFFCVISLFSQKQVDQELLVWVLVLQFTCFLFLLKKDINSFFIKWNWREIWVTANKLSSIGKWIFFSSCLFMLIEQAVPSMLKFEGYVDHIVFLGTSITILNVLSPIIRYIHLYIITRSVVVARRELILFLTISIVYVLLFSLGFEFVYLYIYGMEFWIEGLAPYFLIMYTGVVIANVPVDGFLTKAGGNRSLFMNNLASVLFCLPIIALYFYFESPVLLFFMFAFKYMLMFLFNFISLKKYAHSTS